MKLLKPWEEREKEAHELGTLVHLINLDPSYASSDVEDIISSAFKLKADAKIVLNVPSFDSSYGQALVIFNSKADADFVRNELNKNCLIVEGSKNMTLAFLESRPLIARKSSLNEPSIASNFPGHLIIDKLSKIKSDKRKALSTSHCSQANTIEHEMAMQWRFLQSKNDLCWKTLHE
ncbi:Protein ANTI-SILENCING 1, partial [Bienertia sinuspersici]